MKKFLKLSIVFVLMLSTIICLGGCNIFEPAEKPADSTTPPTTPPVTPPAPVTTTINYVSLGDSIPDGVSLDKYVERDEFGFVEGSYAYTYRAYLQENYDTVNAISYAVSGQTSTQLLTNLTNLSGAELDEDNQKMKEDIAGADVITICIGANDILGPATANLYNFLMEDTDITPYLDAGLATFTTNFPQIVAQLEELNSTAKLVFSNVYNPYKEYIDRTTDISITAFSYPYSSISADKIVAIGNITEVYLDSGSLNGGAKTIENGLNQIIENNIEEKDNCSLLDVKDAFDTYYTRELETGDKKYDIVQTDVITTDTINIISINPNDIMAQISVHLDPHPTEKGHALIAELLLDWYNSLS